MTCYASVIIDVSSRDINRAFEYKVPEVLERKTTVGASVVVPFGRTVRLGYVIETSEAAKIERHANLIGVIDEPPIFDTVMAKLAGWTAEKYISSTADVIRIMLPPGRGRRLTKIVTEDREAPQFVISEPKVDSKTEEYARLSIDNKNLPKAILTLKNALKNAPKQRRGITALTEGPLPAHRLASEFGINRTSLRSLASKGYIKIYRQATFREPDFTYPDVLPLDLNLTKEQDSAVDNIMRGLKKGHSVFLLQGVTGSGKTEVYLRVIEETIRQGKSAIVLVPEIALTPQTVSRFRSRFGEKIAVLHSGLGLGERYDQWRRIRNGDFRVVVGARSAVWAPAQKLGLIVVDEEHETSYKQDRTPRYHARDVAIERARLTGASVILGSATPSIESRYRADKRDFDLLVLPTRIKERPMPAVEIIDMRAEEKIGESGFFSRRLVIALRETIENGDKAILFLNRRGFANFIICRDCGNVIFCERCNVSLTYHSKDRSLVCHHCGYRIPAPSVCPECSGTSIGFFGAGTERVETEIQKLFPDTAITRMDSDTTTLKDSHRKKLGRFREQTGGILLGTQMIAKGLDFPDVTLVGIINADTSLNLPDFRAGERTFQLMMQVGGRAGRGLSPGNVLVQTYSPDNYAIQALVAGSYDTFYETEITLRDALDYPPFSELINIVISSRQEKDARAMAENVAEKIIRAREAGNLPGVKEILGPSPAPLSRLNNRYRWHVVLKSDGSIVIKSFLRENCSRLTPKDREKGITVVFDVDPMSLL